MKFYFPEYTKDLRDVLVEAEVCKELKEVKLIHINFTKRTKLEEIISLDELLPEGMLTLEEEAVEISNELDIQFEHPSWGVIRGKVDTGADQTSLHAEDIKIDGSVVRFTRNGSRYSAALAGTTEVSSADSDNTRPNIEVSIMIPSTGSRQKVIINLNDRSSMPSELLIGMDILSNDEDILINPSLTKVDEAATISEHIIKEAIQKRINDQIV